MKTGKHLLFIALLLTIMVSCKSKSTDSVPNSAKAKVQVKTTKVEVGGINEIISLNGKSVFLKKNAIISSIPGYLKKINVQYGDKVNKNDLLFEIQTKENRALENSGLNTELSSSTSGVIRVYAPSKGIISDLNANSSGMYVTEGGLLCTVVESNEMTVQVNVPYGYNQLIEIKKECKIVLPDSTILDGNIYKIMPVIKEVSQTQNVLIRVRSNRQIPENLNVIVQFVKSSHLNTLLIPKEALLTNEVQQAFWVMKILDDSIAIRVPVKKGIGNNQTVEILSTNILANDLVIIEGAYGLSDSTLVKIVK